MKSIGYRLIKTSKYTLPNNNPNVHIIYQDLDLKSLIIEALHKGQLTGPPKDQDFLLIAVPFVCNVLRAVTGSKVFAPPNAWTMGLLGLLVEIHNLPDIKVSERPLPRIYIRACVAPTFNSMDYGYIMFSLVALG